MSSSMANTKFAGWNQTTNSSFETLFSESNLNACQKRITELLQGVGPNGRPIIVPTDTISSVLYQCFQTNKPQVGDIYSRYIQSEYTTGRDDLTDITSRAINIIVSQIRTEYGMIECNKRLTIWNTVLGDFNQAGLRSHPQIKLKLKRPEPMQFNMNY